MSWPKASGSITRRFTATHALDVAGGCNEPHAHDYTAEFGFTHEFSPHTGLIGSKALQDWNADIDGVLALVDGQDLNAVLSPRPPTLEFLTLFLLSKLPGYFAWVELRAYEPLLTIRMEHRGARVEWLLSSSTEETK